MGGANCSVVNCHASKSKNRGLCFAKVPQKGVNDEWRSKLLHIINRCDPGFNPDTAHICSRHFDDTCFTTGPTGRKKLIPGSVPDRNLPVKSIEIPKAPERKPPVPREAPPLPQKVYHLNLSDVRREMRRLPHPWIILQEKEDTVSFGVVQNCNITIRVDVCADLSMDVRILGGLRVSNCCQNLEGVRLDQFLTTLSSLQTCTGVTSPELQQFAQLPTGASVYYVHVQNDFVGGMPKANTCVRASQCHGLLKNCTLCVECEKVEKTLQAKLYRKKEREAKPLEKNDPLHCMSAEKLKLELKECRQREKKLKAEVDAFREKLKEESVPVSDSLHTDLQKIISENNIADPLTKLFWEEQKKAFSIKGPKGMKWHPMMIRMALLLHSRGPSAYNTLRETGVLRLPGESTLRDYTNYIHPRAGFQPEVLDEIKTAASKLAENKRYVVLLHDEMSIKEDLVFDAKTNEIVGFANIHDWAQNRDKEKIATHALVFYVVGINSDLKISMGFFGTRTANADALYQVFWQAIGFLETKCMLKVIASTSDKASPNMRLYQLHGDKTEVCHKTINFMSLDRYIYFFSDVPHLIKTIRNNVLKSGPGKSMYLWKNGREIVWKHIADIYHNDRTRELVRTKLTKDHIFPSGRTLMNVKLAAQVLSRTVGLVLQKYGEDAQQETADFILKIDTFFDCLNARSLEHVEAAKKNKPNLRPYRDVNDIRFDFLDGFLTYLTEWKMSVESRPGNFRKSERAKMFLTHQTFKGLTMTIKSFKEATRFLLHNGVDYVLSNKFCQDPLEAHFGRHRGLSRRSENPTLHTFGFQENKIRIQRSMAMIVQPQGNIEKRKRMNDRPVISNSPVKKARR